MRAKFLTLRFKHLVLLFLVTFTLLIIFHLHHYPVSIKETSSTATPSTSLDNILFCVASSSSSLSRRLPYIRLWHTPNKTRAVVFLDKPHPQSHGLIRTVVSEPTSTFPYTYPRGHRSAIRIARMVKEAVRLGEPGVKWFVLGDDDTVFFPENVERALAKYDCGEWYYVGSRSESVEQNVEMSFEMAYGGGGFALSAALAKVLERVVDSCLFRYAHLYGSDGRVFSCLAELGVPLTLEPGFHQFDVRGSLVGMLSAHPLSPALSLHHLDVVEPLFPNMTRIHSLQHLFKAFHLDPPRLLQQSVCYSASHNLSVSLSWGYAVQIYHGRHFITDLISPLTTFTPWKRGARNGRRHYAIDTTDYPANQCKRPVLFFFHGSEIKGDRILGTYVKRSSYDCKYTNAIRRLRDVRISSTKLDIAPTQQWQRYLSRRECCDIVHPFDTSLYIHVRPCGEDELIAMLPQKQ